MRFRVLGSGSSGNTTLVESGEQRLLIDAGLSPRDLAERLLSAGVDPASLAAVVLSHEHGDHVRGAGAFSRKWGVPLYGSRGTYAAAGLGAEGIAAYNVLTPMTPTTVGAFTVTGVPVPHDAAGPFAFVVAAADHRLGHATDLGHVNALLADAFRGCGSVLIEANYELELLRDGPYPGSVKSRILGRYGHLSNSDIASYLARDLGESCRRVVLAHLSQNNNRPELALGAAAAGLRARRRADVEVIATTTDGTGWLAVPPSPRAPAGPRQLTLW